MTTSKRLLRNFSSLFFGELVNKILRFISIIYLARVLGAGGFGEINFVLAIISYFLIVVNFGLSELGVREVARKQYDLQKFAFSVISLRFFFAAVSFLALLIFILVLPKPIETKNLLLIYGLTLFPYALSTEWVFRGTEKMGYICLAKIAGALFYISLIFSIIKNSSQILWVGFIAFFTDLVTLGILLFFYKRNHGKFKFAIDVGLLKKIITDSFPLGVSSAFLLAYLNFGIVILGFIKNNQIVGLYSAAYRIILIFYAVNDLFIATIFPVISRYYQESKIKLQTFLNRCFKAAIIFGFPVAVLGSLFAKKIILLFYGINYIEASGVFQLLIWFIALNFVSFISSYSLVACDRQRFYMYVLFSAAVLNLVLNIILIPRLSFYGPPIAIIFSELLIIYLALRKLTRQIVAIHFRRFFYKPILSILLSFLVLVLCFKFNLNAVSLFFLGILIYFGALISLRAISKKEVLELKKAINFG